MVILREKKWIQKGDIPLERPAYEENGFWGVGGERIRRIGFAADIGTTTLAVAGYVYTEKKHVFCFGKKSELNRQSAYGKDVMMRIMNAMSGKADKMQKMIITQLEDLAAKMLSEAGFEERQKREDLEEEFVVVGNTTMCHLFLGESVEGLQGMPFSPAYHGNRHLTGEKLGFQKFANASVFVLSGIASHVGSDALSVVLATKLQKESGNVLAVDLGTNAEILLLGSCRTGI